MLQIGYCLSGGGIRGIAHLGMIKALEEVHIRPSIISGTSAGALMGAFYAAGFTPDEILDVAIRARFLTRSYLQWRKAGLFSMTYFNKLFKLFFPSDSFETLKIPLIVATTNIVTGELEYYDSGSLTEVLMASCCVPMVFEPVKMKDSVYIDGGVLDNFPVQPLLEKCDKIVGSYVNDMDLTDQRISMMTVIDRTFNLAINSTLGYKRQYCDLFFSPPNMMRYGILDTRKSKEIFDCGYQYARSILTIEKVQELLA